MCSFTLNSSYLPASNSRCLFCWTDFGKRSTGGTTHLQIQTILDSLSTLLKVNLAGDLRWNCANDGYPFCSECTKDAQKLLRLQEKLVEIQKQVNEGLEKVREKLRATESLVNSTDIKVLSFRSHALIGLESPMLNTHHSHVRGISQSQSEVSSSFFASSGLSPTKASQSEQQYPPNFLPDTSLLASSSSTMHSQPHHIQGYDSLAPDLNQAVQSIMQRPFITNTCDDGHTDHSKVSVTMPDDGNNYSSMSATYDLNYGGGYCVPNEVTEKQPEVINNMDSSEDGFEDDPRDADYNESSRGGDEEERPPEYGVTLVAKRNRRKVSRSGPTQIKKDRPERGKVEIFSEVQTSVDGRMFYEHIEIVRRSERYACGACGCDKFKGINNVALRKMKIHIKGVHLNAYRCELCNKSFTSGDILRTHKKVTHEGSKMKDCPICGRPIQVDMKGHIWTHKSPAEKAESIALGQVPANVKSNLKREEMKPHLCPTCGRRFSKPHNLRQHMNVHVEKPQRVTFKCDQCDKTFLSRLTLKLHIRTVHDRDSIVRWYTCPQPGCGTKYITKQDYDTHYSRKHADESEKKFACDICNRRFYSRNHLRTHIKYHRRAEDFKVQCKICTVKVVSDEALRNHNKKFHPRPKPKPIVKFHVNKVKEDNFSLNKDSVGALEHSDSKGKKLSDLYFVDRTKKNVREKFVDFEKIPGDEHLYFEGYPVLKVEEEKYMCVTCQKTITKSNDVCSRVKTKSPANLMKIHIRAAHQEFYKCEHCDRKCTSRGDLVKHKSQVHFVETVTCSVCGKPTVRGNVRHHLWSHKSPQDMAECINSGDLMPSSFKYRSPATLAKIVFSDNVICCNVCNNQPFERVCDLDDHWTTSHIDRVNSTKYLPLKLRMEICKSRTPKIGKKNGYRKIRTRKKKAVKEKEDSSESDGSSLLSDEGKGKAWESSDEEYESKKDQECSRVKKRIEITGNGRISDRNRHDRNERNPSNAVICLTPIPYSLMSAKTIKILSDELVSCESHTGNIRMVSLGQLDEFNDCSSEYSESEFTD